MSDLSAIGADAMSLASASTAIDAYETAVELETATLDMALEVQAEAILQLLSSMGLGQNLNLLA